ncbi:SAM-dependent methyltransferase [Micromonospora halophytica]|uniref:Methyltransferase domain n=1 Tax=Micromonospora halophytica TaxID=47864 RepID=A0A1C5IAL9_9ACTN|nr:SAM-dependent methyltransferase [Micromonospora halophytica]SCG54786.1 Methyltransferase domain [Micromonospora halophytica]
MTTDWQAWHRDYADPDSPLSRRLELVRQEIGRWLDERPGRALTAVSACAGQGHDLIGVLAGRDDAARVRATLVEYDPGNVAAARAAAAGLDTVTVLRADAGKLASYVGAVPADLVLMVGVFGNVPDFDVRRTVHALPQLCAPDATVVWTRSRRAPDRTPALRRWLREAGFQERAFHAPHDVLFSVGVHRLTGSPRPLDPAGELFRFHPGGPAQTSPRAEPSTDSAPLDTGVLHPYSK